jgi:hypothetical protein
MNILYTPNSSPFTRREAAELLIGHRFGFDQVQGPLMFLAQHQGVASAD